MNKYLVSLLAVGAVSLSCLAGPGSDIRQLITIPSGTTAVTNSVFQGQAVPNAGSSAATAQVISYMANSSSNVTITLSMAGATYTNTMLLATTSGGANTTAAAITGTPVLGSSDNIIVSLGGSNTNSSPVYIYLNYIKH